MTSENVVEGNYIGTDVSGVKALGNFVAGVYITAGPTNNSIGGSASGAGNLISGNVGPGVEVTDAGSNDNVIQGNLIGTDYTGTVALANQSPAVAWYKAEGNAEDSIGANNGQLVGGVSFAAGEVGQAFNLDGSTGYIDVPSSPSLTPLQGITVEAFIDPTSLPSASTTTQGWDIFNELYDAGSSQTGPGAYALRLMSDGSIEFIVGTSEAQSQIGSDYYAVRTAPGLVASDTFTHVAGTYDAATGQLTVYVNGIATTIQAAGTLNQDPHDLKIGADLSASTYFQGLIDEATVYNVALGAGEIKQIGVDRGSAGKGSSFVSGPGVLITAGASNNSVGGTDPGDANIIAFNTSAGVAVTGDASTGNSIRGNSIFGNGALGIDLGQDGVTPNQPGGSATGPNNLQNFPVLTSAVPSATTSVSGTYAGTPDSTFTLDFYANATADPSGYGQGQIYLGSTTVTTDDSGNATFVVTGLNFTSGEAISATATDAGGDTSEFSADVLATLLTANAGGPYSSAEGGLLSLAGSASDPEGGTLTYTWTINGHANAATGASPTLSWAQLQGFGIDDGPDSFAVELTVSDTDGNAASSATTLTLANTPPTASLTGPTIGVPGQPLFFTLGATDPSATDQAAGFTFSINWGDSHTGSVSGLSGITDGHTYVAPGTYTISVTATDKDSGVSTAFTQTVTVATVKLEGGTLAVGGTTLPDAFVLTPVTASSMKVVLNGTNLGTFSFTSLQLYGDGGADTVSINGTAGNDAFALAGATATVNAFTVGLNNMQSVTLNGLAGVDTFTNTLATIQSSLLGSGGNDTFAFAGGGMGAGATVSGGTGTNTLIAPDMVNIWAITAANAGTLNGDSFTGIQNLTGGSLPNDFVFSAGASISGSISGVCGVTLDDSQFVSSVTVNLQTNKVTGVGGTVSNLVDVIGGSATNTLTGANATNTWSISGANSGSVNGIGFSNFGSVAGGSGSDTFDIGNGGSLTGTLAGGAGTNTLVGPDVPSTFAITGTNAGSLNASVIPAFTQMQNLTGGSSPNRFVFRAGTHVTGSVDGGPGGGTLDYSDFTTNVSVNLQTNVVTGVTGTATDVSSVIGSSGVDSLTGPNGSTTWNVTGNNAGNINGTFSFTAFANLSSGAGANDFVLSNGASLTGKINGTAGAATLDYSSFTSDVSVNLQTNVVTAVGGKVTGLVSIIGGSGTNTLTGTNTPNTWHITGANAGDFNGTVAFTAFANLTGGSNSDAFVFSAGASVSGMITGKANTNRLDYRSFGASVYVNLLTAAAAATGGIANIQQVYGSGMGDVLVGNGANVLLSESAGKNLIIGGTGGGATLVSGSGEDIVIAGSTIYDNSQAQLEAIENFWATDSGSFSQRVADLAMGIPAGVKLDGSTVTHHLGAADSITLNSALDWVFWRSTGARPDILTGTPGKDQQI